MTPELNLGRLVGISQLRRKWKEFPGSVNGMHKDLMARTSKAVKKYLDINFSGVWEEQQEIKLKR